MSVFYLDTSALVKRYVREVGTNWIWALSAPGVGNTLILAEIGMVEAAAAIAANHRASRGITLQERDVAVRLLVRHCTAEYELVPTNRSILDGALRRTQLHRLRGYDAVHLASALATNAVMIAAGLAPLSLVAADRDLRDAAAREGLVVHNLEDHSWGSDLYAVQAVQTRYAMQQYPKQIKRALRELMAQAYERELERELRKLYQSFAEWRAGSIGSGELSYRVHQYDTGPSRELFKQYNMNQPDLCVAYAIVVGILQREEVPPEVLAAIGAPLAFYQGLQDRNQLKLPEESYSRSDNFLDSAGLC